MAENFVFDMDGTLCFPGGRLNRHPLKVNRENKSLEELWQDYYRGCSNDRPNKGILNIAKNLNGNVFILTGRDENAREETQAWLRNNGLNVTAIYMRPLKDTRKVAEIKLAQLNTISKEYGDISCIFDDDPRNVNLFKQYFPTILVTTE